MPTPWMARNAPVTQRLIVLIWWPPLLMILGTLRPAMALSARLRIWKCRGALAGWHSGNPRVPSPSWKVPYARCRPPIGGTAVLR
jgi:hypothetical protein